jgi:hypothetical protein
MKMERSKVERCLESLSEGYDFFRSEFSKSNLRPLDASPIQRKPMLCTAPGKYVCLDAAFLLEKAGKAFFWVCRELPSVKDGDALLRFSGAVFEAYFTWVWQKQYQAEGELLSQPEFARGGEIADFVLVEGSNLILFECKASTVTNAAKFSFDPKALGDEINRKFVEDKKEKKTRAKGVGQLARSVGKVTGDFRTELPFDLRAIQRIYCVLVTLDPIIEEPNVRGHLVDEFKRREPRGQIRESIAPLMVLHISDIEWMLTFTNRAGFAELLKDRPAEKHFSGSLMDNRGTTYAKRGWWPQHDVVRARHEELLEQLRKWLP